MLVLFATALTIRGSNLSDVAPYPDELSYWNRGILTLSSNWAWRQDFMSDQPPLFIYILAVIVAGFDSTIEAIRWPSVIAGSLSTVILYLWGKSMFNRSAGFIAALALAINGFHILYSRLAYIESLTILWLVTAGYLFWEGVVKQRKTSVAILGGILLGLALDTKYIAFLVYPALIAFLKFRRNENKTIFKSKPFIAYIVSSLVVFIPVLVTLIINGKDPLQFQLVGRFQKFRYFQGYLSIDESIIRGIQNWVGLLTHVSSTDPFGVFPPYPIYFALSGALFSAVSIYFIIAFLKGKQKKTLIFALFAIFVAFVVAFPVRRQYYLLYPFAFYTMMLGSVFSLALIQIKARMSKRRFKPLPVLAFVITIMVLTTNALALPSMSANGFGAYDEINPAMDYVKANIVPGGYIGTLLPSTLYYVQTENINATVIPLVSVVVKPQDPSKRIYQTPFRRAEGFKMYVITVDVIRMFKPQFLIIQRPYYDLVLTTAMKGVINEQYRLSMAGDVTLLFERTI